MASTLDNPDRRPSAGQRGKKHTLVTPLTPLIADFLAFKKQGGASPASERSWRSTLYRFAAFAPQALAADLDGPAGLKLILSFTRHTHVDAAMTSHLRSFTKFLRQTGEIEVDPGNDIPSPKRRPPRPEPIRDEAVDKLLGAALASHPLDYLAMLIYAQIGLRKMEVPSIRIRDFDLTGGQFTFTRSKPKRMDSLPFTEEIRLAVEAYVAFAGDEGRQHFVMHARNRVSNLNGVKKVYATPLKPLSATGVQRWWRRLLDAADLPDFRLHRLRHTAGSRFYAATLDPALTQRVMGHADIRTTFSFYVQPDDAALVSGFEKASKEGLGR